MYSGVVKKEWEGVLMERKEIQKAFDHQILYQVSWSISPKSRLHLIMTIKVKALPEFLS